MFEFTLRFTYFGFDVMLKSPLKKQTDKSLHLTNPSSYNLIVEINSCNIKAIYLPLLFSSQGKPFMSLNELNVNCLRVVNVLHLQIH